MAAITTSPGYDTALWTATRRRAPSGAIPRHGSRVSRTSPATFRRRRLAVATSALGGLVLVAATAGVALGGIPLAAPERRPASVSTIQAAAGAPDAGALATVVVEPGDTLWSIASRLAPHDDPRPLVDELSSARDGAPLQVGERIRIPQ